jgi:cephalosporin-C deacetylase
MSIPTDYSFDFDSTQGLGLDELRAIRPPQAPPGFDEFWRARYVRVLGVNPQPRLGE